VIGVPPDIDDHNWLDLSFPAGHSDPSLAVPDPQRRHPHRNHRIDLATGHAEAIGTLFTWLLRYPAQAIALCNHDSDRLHGHSQAAPTHGP
jgi:hypothetical protein